MKVLNSILQSLRASNYLAGKLIASKEKVYCEYIFLKHGRKVREQLLKEWLTISNAWSTQFGGVQKIENFADSGNRMCFLDNPTFQKFNEDIYNEKFINLDNSIAIKTIYTNFIHDFISERNIFHGYKNKTFLVTDYFVASENELYKYNNLQRERKIWWMRFSFNPSRYRFEPVEPRFKKDECDILEKSKSIAITANFSYGLVDTESISLAPLHKLDYFHSSFYKNPCKISLLRSVVDLDLAAIDGCLYKPLNRNYTLMLSRKLAPYQVLLASLHQGNKIIDELTLHIQHIIRKNGLRIYGNILRIINQPELEEKLIHFDGLGISYILLVDDESIKSGLIKMRCRDTTVFETIHIIDIPNYLLHIFSR